MIVAPEDLDLAARIHDSATLHGLGADPEHLGVTADDRARHDKTYNGLATPDDVQSFLANVVRQIDAGPHKPSPVTDVTREKCVRQWREGRSEAAWSRHVCAVCEGTHRRREMDTISDAYDADLVPWGVKAIEKKLEGTDALELLRVRVDKFFTRHRMNFAGYALNPVALFQPDKERADAWASDRKEELCSEEEKLAAFKSLKFGMCKCCASAIKRKKLPPTALALANDYGQHLLQSHSPDVYGTQHCVECRCHRCAHGGNIPAEAVATFPENVRENEEECTVWSQLWKESDPCLYRKDTLLPDLTVVEEMSLGQYSRSVHSEGSSPYTLSHRILFYSLAICRRCFVQELSLYEKGKSTL